MSDMRGNTWMGQSQVTQSLPNPLPAAALAGVRSRRIMAVGIDLIVVGVIAFALWLVLGILSFGLLWFILPPLFPIIAFVYNGVTVSGWRRATPGMRMMDLEVRLTDGAPVPFINAAVHAVLFYLSWCFPVVFIVSLLMGDKRCLHDMLSGLIVLRRAQ